MISVQDQFDNMFCDMKHSLAKLTIGREELADASVRQSEWRGDECGYLASQAMARIERGLTPTEEQAMALESENFHANSEYMLNIERAEYWEER